MVGGWSGISSRQAGAAWRLTYFSTFPRTYFSRHHTPLVVVVINAVWGWAAVAWLRAAR